jgi:hypothetical protein
MLKTYLFAAALTLAVTTAAHAEGSFATASLATPVAKTTQVIAGGAVWTCEGDACRAPATSDRTLSVSSCKQLVREVGPVKTYGVDKHALSTDELTRCDGGKLPG